VIKEKIASLRQKRFSVPLFGLVTLVAIAVPFKLHQAPVAEKKPPAPHILDQANHLTGHVHAKINSNTPHSVHKFVDGCDHNYGAGSVCVPTTLPTGAAGCAYLKDHHFSIPLAVKADDKSIDPSGNSLACDTEDGLN
jgi:hypothetical protein